MKKIIGLCVVAAAMFMTSCALFMTGMTPSQVAKELPTMTKARFMTSAEAEVAVKAGKAKLLTRREYAVPDDNISVKWDLQDGAKGIDEWVTLDGGNAYVLVNYRWVANVGGSKQLHLEFDTLLCE